MTLVTVQLSRQESLNGICDIAKAIEYEWNRAGLELPRRSTLSNANMKRDPKMAENVFWKLLEHFKAISPAFASSRFDGFLARMKNHNIFLLDSSTIQLTLDCFDWARHRRQKAAAKLHMTMELASRLPSFAVVEDAAHHDSKRAGVCTGQLVQGDILVADRAHLDFSFLKKKLLSLLELYGTAGAVILRMPRTKSLYFQPLLNFANAPNGTEEP